MQKQFKILNIVTTEVNYRIMLATCIGSKKTYKLILKKNVSRQHSYPVSNIRWTASAYGQLKFVQKVIIWFVAKPTRIFYINELY